MAARPPNPAPDLVAAGATLDQIADVAAGCVSCPLHEDALQTVFGEGAVDARYLLVGEQPGDSEDKEGRPFVGPSGRLLDSALAAAGVDRSATYVTNVVKHFKWKPGPASKPRLHATPRRDEVVACQPWLEAEIIRVDPAVVVCLGATVTRALLGTGIRVTRDHGTPIELGDRHAVVTIHPSAVLRAGGERRATLYDQLVGDLAVAARTSAQM